LCCASSTFAQIETPPELRGWEEWALHGHETHRCPWLVPGKPVDDGRICAWPAALELQLDARGGRFSQRWQVAAESWLPLPGTTDNWPEDVTIDGLPAAVVAHDGTPTLRVAPGAHSVSGSFRWSRRPELLTIPSSVALVSLTIDAARVAAPQRSSAGILLGAQRVAREDDRIDVRVFRRLDDSLPARLTTEVHLAVAGEAREIRLPKALPEGFVPTALEGALAARLDPDDTLRVQVRPGEFELTVQARGPSPATEVRLGARPAPWPAEEVWSFQSQDRLRVAAIEGVSPTDPAQANVPQHWRELPAYRLNPTSVLRVVERSRGLSAQAANDLRLRRTAWLDFSGTGYTIVDSLSGQMRRDWRLDMSAPYSLQSARTASQEPLLVTTGTAPDLTGVELRDPQVNLTAVSRLRRSGGSLPATGWRERLTDVSGQLIVGPGYRLLAAIGPDAAPQAWLERWRLLDIFVVLLIATVTWRVLGVHTAAIAIAAIGLTYQESGSPTWLWLNLLVAIALLRAIPQERVRRWLARYRALAFAAVLLALIPFAIAQVRLAVYPQLEALAPAAYVAARAPVAPTVLEDMARPAELREVAPAAPGILTSVSPAANVAAVSVTGMRATARYEPGAVVQAGPGLPQWRYHVYDYSWSGPVEVGATARFVISPPWMTRLWRLLGVALALLLLFELTKKERPLGPAGWRSWLPTGTGAALILGLIAGLGAGPKAYAATTPDPVILGELQARLLAQPKCAPDCADIVAAAVNVGPTRLAIVLTVSALDSVGIALPGAEPKWVPDLVQVDGAAGGGVYRNSHGARFVTVARGRHVVRVEGPLAAVDALSVAFPISPHVIDVTAPGWDIGGVSERHLVSGALELARRRLVKDTGTAMERQEEFPPYVSVDRLFHLAHEWTIDTTAARVAPKSAAFTVKLRLLPQEAVTTPGLKASDGAVSVGLAAGESEQTFTSVLPSAQSLELVASTDASYSEHWRFDVASTWHAEFSGVPAVNPEQDVGPWSFEYYPRPGERLQVAVTRPAATGGGSVAFDRVQLHARVGKRSSETTLALGYRSTQGGRHVLHIPADAAVTSILSDGAPVALRPEHGELSLSALPGTHTWSIAWLTPVGARLLTRAPSVSLSAPASNLRLSIQLPENRWVLYAFGPGVGPSILYWGELLVFVVVAWLIGRSSLTPLPTRDWLLLGLGLSTFSWLVLALFVLFVVVFQWRARHGPPAEPDRFNLLQLGLCALGVIAVVAVVAAVPSGLLAQPDMRIEPPGNPGELSWFVDQTADRLPAPAVLSVSLWWYKLAMLAWALWLSFALTRWVAWAWQVLSRDGLWRGQAVAPPPLRTEPLDADQQ
jgi:hypothetical protein